MKKCRVKDNVKELKEAIESGAGCGYKWPFPVDNEAKLKTKLEIERWEYDGAEGFSFKQKPRATGSRSFTQNDLRIDD
jgi:hypothetical protein